MSYINGFFKKLEEEMRLFHGIWEKIFKDITWPSLVKSMGLKLILVGDGLHKLADKQCYLVLVDGDFSGDLRYKDPKILECLNPHHFNKETNEVTFTNSNIILNIDQQIERRDFITVAPKKIFSRSDVSSAALVWGEATLRDISPSDVTGSTDKASLDTVSVACYFRLSDKKWCWDQYFQAHDCPDHFPFARAGLRGKHRVK